MHLIPALRKQVILYEFKDSQGFTVRSCLKKYYFYYRTGEMAQSLRALSGRPHGGSQPSIIPVPGDLMPPFCL